MSAGALSGARFDLTPRSEGCGAFGLQTGADLGDLSLNSARSEAERVLGLEGGGHRFFDGGDVRRGGFGSSGLAGFDSRVDNSFHNALTVTRYFGARQELPDGTQGEPAAGLTNLLKQRHFWLGLYNQAWFARLKR